MDIDEIISRAEVTETVEAPSAHSDFLNQFKVADFGTANLASNWDSIIPENERQRIEDEEAVRKLQENLVTEPRKRKQTTYAEAAGTTASGGERAGKRAAVVKASGETTGLRERQLRALLKAMKRYGASAAYLEPIRVEASLTDVGTAPCADQPSPRPDPRARAPTCRPAAASRWPRTHGGMMGCGRIVRTDAAVVEAAMQAVVTACRTAAASDDSAPRKPGPKPKKAAGEDDAKDEAAKASAVMAEVDGVRIDPRELLRAVDDMAVLEQHVPYARSFGRRAPGSWAPTSSSSGARGDAGDGGPGATTRRLCSPGASSRWPRSG